MKRSKKFLLAFLAMTLVFSALFAAVSCFQLNILKNNLSEKTVQIVANIKKSCPQISDVEIAEILNGRDTNTEEAKKILEKYGITDLEWSVFENESAADMMILMNAVMCGVFCLIMCGAFIIYVRMRQRETKQITNYISRINNKEYDLSIEQNSEDEMSLLKNEVYKVTVMLREQADNSLTAKENLKNSLSDISHQLKTPITSIMIMVDNILDDDNMPVELRRDFMKDIRRETTGISFLVKSLLTLSRIDADTIEFKHKTESVNSIIKECVQRISVLAELKNVNIEVQPQNNINLDCDFKWVCEAITNIIKNCIEHTPAGGTVEIAASQNKIYTKISIKDNGCGIAAKDLPHIFERFYKGKNSREDSVGIGLALAKTIIEKSGGIVSVDSAEGRGSVFDIKFFPVI